MYRKRNELRQQPELRQTFLPTLVYYLRLIELPNLELDVYLRQEIESNPMLEESSTDEINNENIEEPVFDDREEEIPEKEKREQENEFDIAELFADEPAQTTFNFDEYRDPIDNIADEGERLYDLLLRQARSQFEGIDLEIAELVIVNINEDGHLATGPEEIAGKEYSIDQVKNIIKQIQRFDPVGCAWQDPRDPLMIQLAELGFDENSVECQLVRDHLKELQSNHNDELMKKLSITETQLLKAKEMILKLDPKPGWRCSNARSKYVSCDFIVRWRENNLIGHLNDEYIQRIRIKRQYREILKNPNGVNKEELAFIKHKLQSAQNLIIAIEQRRKTLNRILEGILEFQKDFFRVGYDYLKPMTMTEFARQLNVNPSTISRALANKYLESPWGIHSMKFFFKPAVADTDKRIIFNKIKDIILNEDKTAPLSDTQIAKKLSRDGIIISRRTVSKYRDLLKIPAHQFRRS
ncbi:RNA polymerase sigma-54 factor [candidate division WOR-3 bacterium RBG_13_43_14]|uniref:RNA polymerase sigma-54 factor n=1 Tax=candidate division WOR-3 bacterium RBG_13_43_14 TaxID=1802590 RepID=A0A1F4U3E3_UNCW3|nr:MAG: RNA polymerase sigma-54 factor [candidate division WOR-3 bacterium RBG_13_43_14]